MKMFLLVASIAFTVLTFVCIGFVLFGQFYGAYPLVPMVFAITSITAYHRKHRTLFRRIDY
jgi:hypothetical protein